MLLGTAEGPEFGAPFWGKGSSEESFGEGKDIQVRKLHPASRFLDRLFEFGPAGLGLGWKLYAVIKFDANFVALSVKDLIPLGLRQMNQGLPDLFDLFLDPLLFPLKQGVTFDQLESAFLKGPTLRKRCQLVLMTKERTAGAELTPGTEGALPGRKLLRRLDLCNEAKGF